MREFKFGEYVLVKAFVEEDAYLDLHLSIGGEHVHGVRQSLVVEDERTQIIEWLRAMPGTSTYTDVATRIEAREYVRSTLPAHRRVRREAEMHAIKDDEVCFVVKGAYFICALKDVAEIQAHYANALK